MNQSEPVNQSAKPAANTGVQLLEVSSHSDEQRLDNFLLSRLKGLPKSHLYRLIRKGEIRVNKKRCKPDQRVFAGDIVRVAPLRLATPDRPTAPAAGLVRRLQDSILYEDESLMVINKPAGLAVHGGTGVSAGLIEALRHMAAEQGAEPGQDDQDRPFRELVHRLDKETSGCLVVAKTGKMLKALQAEMKAGNFQKNYLALVHGQWPEHISKVDAPLLKHHPSEGESYSTIDEAGKPSITLFAVRARLRETTLVEATLVTGRTHQIRVHTQSVGHSIVGDTRYTWNRPHGLQSVRFMCLHAASLRFSHPLTRATVQVSAPLPDTMQSLLESLKAS